MFGLSQRASGICGSLNEKSYGLITKWGRTPYLVFHWKTWRLWFLTNNCVSHRRYSCLPPRDRPFGFKTSRFRDFCLTFYGFGSENLVSVLVSENLVSGKKLSVSVSENLVSEKKSRFRKFWYRKKSLGIGFGQNFGIVIQCWVSRRRHWLVLGGAGSV